MFAHRNCAETLKKFRVKKGDGIDTRSRVFGPVVGQAQILDMPRWISNDSKDT